jgi:hypothetical protein
VHGLGPDDVFGSRTKNFFIFDTHWSSILGEMGFVAGLLYMVLWFFPAIRAFPFLWSADVESRSLAFIVCLVIVSVFVEGMASPAPGQILFILIYVGLGAMALRLLRKAETAQ